jgi:hypothetical protein
MKGMRDNYQRYSNVLYSLNEDMVQLVLDIVENLPAINPYEELKERLLQALTPETYESFKQLMIISSPHPQRTAAVCTPGGYAGALPQG